MRQNCYSKMLYLTRRSLLLDETVLSYVFSIMNPGTRPYNSDREAGYPRFVLKLEKKSIPRAVRGTQSLLGSCLSC
jgi:hypothetical protein